MGIPVFPFFNEAKALILQPDGKLVVVGDGSATGVADESEEIWIARYNPDGSLDTSFGNAGVATLDFGGDDEASAVVLDSAGNIVVAGWGPVSPTSGQFQLELARFLPDGSIDSTFNKSGKATLVVGQGLLVDSGLALTPGGEIDAFGYSSDTSSPINSSNFVARFLPNGSPDPSLNGDGYETYRFSAPFDGFAGGIAVQPDGKMLIAGDFGLARLDPNGSMDTSFNGTGLVTPSAGAFGAVTCSDVILEPDGKILVSGFAGVSGPSSFINLEWLRYTSGGAVDASEQQWDGGDDYATSLALSSSGQVVVAGEGFFDSNRVGYLDLWQIDANGPPTATIGGPTGAVIGQNVTFNIGASIRRWPSSPPISPTRSTGATVRLLRMCRARMPSH